MFMIPGIIRVIASRAGSGARRAADAVTALARPTAGAAKSDRAVRFAVSPRGFARARHLACDLPPRASCGPVGDRLSPIRKPGDRPFVVPVDVVDMCASGERLDDGLVQVFSVPLPREAVALFDPLVGELYSQFELSLRGLFGVVLGVVLVLLGG
jgi:hypothetical protein